MDGASDQHNIKTVSNSVNKVQQNTGNFNSKTNEKQSRKQDVKNVSNFKEQLGPAYLNKSSLHNDPLRLSDIEVSRDDEDPDKSGYDTIQNSLRVNEQNGEQSSLRLKNQHEKLRRETFAQQDEEENVMSEKGEDISVGHKSI